MIDQINNVKSTLEQSTLPSKSVIETIQKEVKEIAEVHKHELDKILSTLNSTQFINDKLNFSYANDEHQLLVQIRDSKTDDLIRQYPSEEFLTRLRYYRNNIGVLFDIIS